MKRNAFPRQRHGRRGTVAVLVAVSMFFILAFAALVLDIGNLYVARAELQRAADAAALAGASAYVSDAGLIENTPTTAGNAAYDLATDVQQRSSQYASVNPTRGEGTLLEGADVNLARYDFNYPQSGLDFVATTPNAVQVIARRTAGSANGSVALFLAGIFGIAEGNVTATAAAAFDDRLAGYDQNEGGLLIPLAIKVSTYDAMLNYSADEFSYDEASDAVSAMPDGVSEIIAFPWKFKDNYANETDVNDTLSQEGAGNYGFLNIGGSGNVSQLEAQITNGVSPAELQTEIGTSSLDFVADDGTPITYQVPGTPGTKSGVEDEFQSRVGDVIAFLLYDSVTGTGSNAMYNITSIRFGRVMYADLSGSKDEKRLVIQPVVYDGPGVWVEESAPSSNGQAGRLALVK